VIGGEFFKVLQCTLTRARLAESWKCGVTRLLAKVDGVPTVTELCPITLLLCSYKILTSILTFRVRLVLHEVIRSNQLAVPGKQIMSGGFNLIAAINYINQCAGHGGAVVSLDDIKAFDRASVMYCDLVLLHMDFPPQFRAWVRMLHSGASTKLMFGSCGLSPPIKVTFSLRQGDGLSMPLYCIQREPFLRRIAAVLSGLRIGRNPVVSFKEIDEDFADDTNLVISEEEDVIKLEEVLQRYEAQSGSLVSRNNKCKIIFLGSWRERTVAPLPWLKVVTELRVFGLILTPDYSTTLTRTWAEVYRGFEKTVYSWKNRNFESMRQRVQALETFALSKLWYVGQILPLPHTVAKKIEKTSSTFLFEGKTERLKLLELCLPLERGGLGFSEIRSRADALRLKQLCRMLDQKGGAYRHLCFWLAPVLRNFLPEMMDLSPVYHGTLPVFLQGAADLLLEGFNFFAVSPTELPDVKSRLLYKSFTSDLPDAKVTEKFPAVNFPRIVWPRLSLTVLDPAARQMVFELVHGLVRNRARLFSQSRAADPWCSACGEVAGQQGQQLPQDLVHLFTSCCLVREAWNFVRALVRKHQLGAWLPPMCLVEEEMVTFTFVKEHQDQEIVWILANYFEMVWRESVTRGRVVTAAGVRGMLKSKYTSVKLRKVGILCLKL
jgi:hypothetical protein